MPYAVQLYFDPITDAMVRDLWRRFAQMGITRHLEESANRPHVTLAIYDDLDVVAAERKLVQFVRPLAQFTLTFSHLGSFVYPSPVAFLAPIVTVDLLRLHGMTHATFTEIGTHAHEHYLPGQWVPHCTLALHMAAEALPSVMEVGLEIGLPVTGAVTEIGIAQVSPTMPLFSAKLIARISSIED